MQAHVPVWTPGERPWAAPGAGVTLGGFPASAVPRQVSGVGYNGKGTVCLLPSREVLREFSNVSVGKLVEVSRAARRHVHGNGPRASDGAVELDQLVLGTSWATPRARLSLLEAEGREESRDCPL